VTKGLILLNVFGKASAVVRDRQVRVMIEVVD